jgi:hypothetical protein
MQEILTLVNTVNLVTTVPWEEKILNFPFFLFPDRFCTKSPRQWVQMTVPLGITQPELEAVHFHLVSMFRMGVA